MAMSGGGIGVSAMLAVIDTWCGSGFIGGQNIEYVGFAIFCVVAGILLSAIAMARLETWPDRRAGLLRGLTTLLVMMQVVSVYVWWLDKIYGIKGLGVANSPALGALGIPLLILMLIIPTFTTGEIYSVEARKFGKYLLWGWTPKGLARGRLASGTPFIVLLTLLCLAAYAICFAFFGKTGDVWHSASLPGTFATTAPAPPVPTAAPQGYTGTISSRGTTTVYRNGTVVSINGQPVTNPPAATAAPATAPAQRTGLWDSPGDFVQAAMMILVFVIGFSMLCQFLSIAFNNRWVAWAIAYLILFVILVLPWISGLMTDSGSPWFTVNLAYLNPFFALGEMTEVYGSPYTVWLAKNLVLGGLPMWLPTTVLWTVIGCASFLATLPFVARRAMTSKAIPYEEMVVSV